MGSGGTLGDEKESHNDQVSAGNQIQVPPDGHGFRHLCRTAQHSGNKLELEDLVMEDQYDLVGITKTWSDETCG